MARPIRADRPGEWFHLMGRGIARRSVFEDRRDFRFFLACLARAVRAGCFDVHAYSLPMTHFHLLVRSKGGLSDGMRNTLGRYTRRFNWRRPGRDGALFRGRFRSKPVESERYRTTLIRYIDFNAVEARLANSPVAYPWCSAHFLAREGRPPPWLSSSWTDPERIRSRRSGAPVAYSDTFGAAPSPDEVELVRRRILYRGEVVDDLDALLVPGLSGIRAWLGQRTFLADQSAPGPSYPLAGVSAIRAIVSMHRLKAPSALLFLGARRSRSLWDVAEAFLLRELAGAGVDEIVNLIDRDSACVRRLLSLHSARVEDDLGYREIVEQLVRQVLDRCHGTGNVTKCRH